MNTITIAEIKRGGMAALDTALHLGAATILKRNRPAAIVLTPAAYAALLEATAHQTPATSALDLLLDATQTNIGGLDGTAMRQRLDGLSAEWSER